MENMKMNETIIRELRKYYQDIGLTIVGFNDSQGVNTTSIFFKKGLLEYLASALATEELRPVVINAFSLLMNKTEHIDYFLKNDLSVEEIKLSQIYSVVSALEKVFKDIHLPQFIGKLGYISSLIYGPKPGDSKIKLASTLRYAYEPTLIYSSGVNDLMREVYNNPFGIKNDYNNRDKTPNFNYTLEKCRDPLSLQNVIDRIESNFYHILGLNDKTDIYTLGAYVPKSLQKEEMNVFKDLIIQYNEYLEKLCKDYGVTFVDTENIGKSYNNNELNFHISTEGHNMLANYILVKMYENKILKSIPKGTDRSCRYRIVGDGAAGVSNSCMKDYKECIQLSEDLTGYERQVMLQIADEHKRESEVFQRILRRKK